MGVFLGMLWVSIRQMRDRGDPLLCVIGTMAFIACVTNLVIGVSSRAFVSRPSMMGMWCAFAVSLRFWTAQRAPVAVERTASVPDPVPSRTS